MSNNLSIPVDEIRYLSEVMAKSGLFGKTPEQIASLALIAHAEGRPLATVAIEYDVIKGRPALSSRAGLARFQAAGGKIKWIESNSKIARAVFYHEAGGELEICWTIERAKEIGLTNKDNWKMYPDQMLRARCAADGVRAVYPACLGALYLTDEDHEEALETTKHENTRTIVSNGVEVVVKDETDDEGRGTVQVSENTATVISRLKEFCKDKQMDCSVYLDNFEKFLRHNKKLGENEFLNVLKDDVSVNILDNWSVTIEAFHKRFPVV